MSLTKEVTADKIEVVATEDGSVVQVRTATKIVEDGEVISSSYHRHVINSGDDWSSEPSNVQAICNAVFGA
jgi:archaellum component FlaF (FlaF/FlaG flagellin family)